MILMDYHMHSQFSHDSQEDLEQISRRAIQLGLKEIALTDHLEFNGENFYLSGGEYLPVYVKNVLDWQTRHKKELKIRLGVEVTLLEDNTLDYLKQFHFDFILGSTHKYKGIGLSGPTFWKDRTEQESYSAFFENAYKLLERNDYFSVVGHLDYITRYKKQSGEAPQGLDLSLHEEQIRSLLKLIIDKDRGLEINTSGFRYGENRTYPSKTILEWYRKMGGEILTIGSDSHNASDMARDFHCAENIAKEAGFRYITTFSQLEKVWIPLS